MHTDYGTAREHLTNYNGLDTLGSTHKTVTPPHSIPVIYIEVLLFRNISPFNV